jgi:hypothetical protein
MSKLIKTSMPVGIQFGEYVTTSRHNYKGRVYSSGILDIADPLVLEWIEIQNIPVTEEQTKGTWLSILVHNGGSVVAPLDSITVIDKFDFINRDSEKTFNKMETA